MLYFDGDGATLLSQVTVLREDVYLAVPQGHRLADRTSTNLDELKDEAFIGYKEDFIFQQMNDKFFQEAGIAPDMYAGLTNLRLLQVLFVPV